MMEVLSPVDVTFPENIRLIIWDLDDTFWSGTVTEGGMTYDDDHHALVIRLAERGIMSSICSKNDFAVVKAILEEKGLWRYFIFPSIDWTPKASRLASMIDAIGLRPASVLFVDDNPQNLAQAKDRVSGLNVALPGFIREIADHPRFQGKADPDLSRLQQYQKLSDKVDAQKGFAGSNVDFLRKSNIRIYIEYDVETHIDRVIELVNRTNQLNFTKERLPEDRAEAVAELVPFLRHAGTKAGLIRVVDDFGDYGFVGFYALTTDNREDFLRHLCFSCRTINMGIEQYIYAMLRRPHLKIVGEVISDLDREAEAPDWIRALPIADLGAGEGPTSSQPISRMFARGGCDLMTLMHYFSLNCSDITTEFNGIKNWQLLRSDHSSFLVNALRRPGPDELAAAAKLGYDGEDFLTRFPWHDRSVPVVLLSFWADADIPRYRHRATGLELPYYLNGGGMGDLISDTALAERLADRPEHRERVAVLREEWEYLGGLSLPEMIDRYKDLAHAVAAESLVVLLTSNERRPEAFTQPGVERDPGHAQYNAAIRTVAATDPHVILIETEEFIKDERDLMDINHFRREIYFDIYRAIISAVRARMEPGGRGEDQRQAAPEMDRSFAQPAREQAAMEVAQPPADARSEVAMPRAAPLFDALADVRIGEVATPAQPARQAPGLTGSDAAAPVTSSTSSPRRSTPESEHARDLLAERVTRTLSRLLPPRWRP